MQFSVLASVYRGLVDILLEGGWERDKLVDAIGTDLQCLETPQQALAIEHVTRLWELGYELHGETIGIHAAQRVKPVDLQDLGVLLGASQNISEWMKLVDHYSALFSNVGEFKSTLKSSGLEITITYHAPVPLLFERLEFIALMHPVWVSQYLSSPLQLSRVELTRPAPPNSTEWDAAFGVKVQWNAPVTKYVIDYREASRLILTRNEQVKNSFERILQDRLKQQAGHSHLDRIRLEIANQLGRETPSLESVAATLNTSGRTLQRQLKKSETCFSEVLAEVRFELAKRYLALNTPVKEIAYRLGYTEAGNFNRAFTSWAGVPPSQFNNS